MSKIVFLTGGTSLLGLAFLKFIPKDAQVIVAQHRLRNQIKHPQIHTVKLDILNKKKLAKLVSKYKPNVFFHAASISNVDYCQNHKKEAWRVNIQGTLNALEVSQNSSIHFIYISSNAVFDGKKDLYKEKDLPNPVNFYGMTKYVGELLTQSYLDSWTIIRPITMYGWSPKDARINPVTWVLENLRSAINLRVVNDVYLNPLFNLDLGELAWKIINNKSLGIYHIAGPEVLNRYEWALKTAKVFGLNSNLISPTASSFFKDKIATRPAQTIYSIEKIKKEFKFQPKTVSEGLNIMKKTESKSS